MMKLKFEPRSGDPHAITFATLCYLSQWKKDQIKIMLSKTVSDLHKLQYRIPYSRIVSYAVFRGQIPKEILSENFP